MRTAISIMQKVLVNHFYKLNAGLLMFLFYVFFGLPQDVKAFHVSIATMIVTNQTALILTMLLWLLYNIKCIDYTIKQIKEPQQLFLSCLECMSSFKCFVCLLYTQFILYLPVIGYAIFVAFIATKNQAYITASTILFFAIAITLATPILYTRILSKRERKNKIYLSKIRLLKPAFIVPLFYIIYDRRQMLLVTKFFSLFFLWIFIKAFEPDHYDIRPLLMCFLLSAVANCTVVFEIKNFEDNHLQFYRNFPFSILKRFVNILLLCFVLLLPELMFVWKAYPLHFNLADYCQLVIDAVGLLALLHVCLFMDNIKMESFIKVVFGIAMALFFIILYNPGILLGIFITGIAFALFRSYYYDFEKQ